jgi:hypothetical protein
MIHDVYLDNALLKSTSGIHTDSNASPDKSTKL